MKKTLVLLIACLLSITVFADSQYFIDLNGALDQDADPYVVDTGVVEVVNHSMVDIYVENILDPARYKDWEFKV